MSKINNHTLGQKIRAVRVSKQLSQDNVATDLGLSLTGYANIENGKTNIPFTRLCDIATYFKLSVVELLTYSAAASARAYAKKPVKPVVSEDDVPIYVTKQLEELTKEIAYLKQLLHDKDRIIGLLEGKK